VLETLCKALKCTPNDIFGYAPKKESKALFSVRTAAEKLGISESKAWAMIRDGRLPSEKNGGHRSINEKDLAVEFMNKYYKPKKAAK
jgi:excisionase family DNA binding protein